MTGKEWLACEAPWRMLTFLRDRLNGPAQGPAPMVPLLRLWGLLAPRKKSAAVWRPSVRKVRLLASAYCRITSGIVEGRGEMAAYYYNREVEAAEVYAESADERYRPLLLQDREVAPLIRSSAFLQEGAALLGNLVESAWQLEGACHPAYRARCCAALRDVVGPLPFGPAPWVAVSVRDWDGGTVEHLARAASQNDRVSYSGHLNQQRIAVLSDALEEAGCDDDTILSHLRGPGPHVRGCWALDLVLGKS